MVCSPGWDGRQAARNEPRPEVRSGAQALPSWRQRRLTASAASWLTQSTGNATCPPGRSGRAAARGGRAARHRGSAACRPPCRAGRAAGRRSRAGRRHTGCAGRAGSQVRQRRRRVGAGRAVAFQHRQLGTQRRGLGLGHLHPPLGEPRGARRILRLARDALARCAVSGRAGRCRSTTRWRRPASSSSPATGAAVGAASIRPAARVPSRRMVASRVATASCRRCCCRSTLSRSWAFSASSAVSRLMSARLADPTRWDSMCTSPNACRTPAWLMSGWVSSAQ